MNLEKEGNGVTQPLSFQNVLVLAKDFTPTRAQMKILNRGLTFIPTIKTEKDFKTKLQLDIQNYHRKIKLAFYYKNTRFEEKKPFMGPSNWSPPQEKLPPIVNELIKKDKDDIKKHLRPYKEKSNLSKEEVKAIRELINNKHIIIKPADKGSVVVILSRQQYIKEVYRQLDNKIYYKKLEQPMYLNTIPLIHEILEKLHKDKFINVKQKNTLKGDITPRPRRFYILPKIHKDPKTWTIPNELPPGRPIVSDCGSESYKTAEFIDYFLNPLSMKHPSYVKDTYHFINLVKTLKIPKSSFLFSMDIESLYTNIDIGAGITCVKNILKKYPDPDRPDEAILKLLEINLQRNDFEFNGEYFLQIKGTAMGKKFAPAYANIFMANWEQEVLQKCLKKPFYYLRYLDDIWGIWPFTMKEFEEFVEVLNTHDPSIKLKHEINEKSINFLDTTIYKGESFISNQKLDIKVFFKETDTHALLYKTSFHPKHTFKGLIKSQLIRFQRICTKNEDFITAVKTLFKSLKHRGYSRTFLRNCFKTFKEKGQRTQKGIIPIITQYSTRTKKINFILKNNYRQIIEERQLLKDFDIISAYRRNKNLKDILVRAKLQPIQQSKQKKLLENIFKNINYVKNQTDGRIFTINQKFNPQTKNCVYIIICSKCGKQYIGETKNKLATRIWQHKYNIIHKKETDTYLVEHFIKHSWTSLTISGLQNNILWTDIERKKRERRWIYWLNTKSPNGLNKK